MIKNNKENVPNYFQDLYKSKSHITIRNNADFILPYYRTSIGQRSIDYILASEWNVLPNKIKLTDKKTLFKKAIKNFLLIGKL